MLLPKHPATASKRQSARSCACCKTTGTRSVAAIPVHAQLAPHALLNALPHAFLLHRAAPGAVRIRVAGQRLHDLLRIDPRGMSIGSLFSAAARDTVMDLVDTAFEGPTIVGLPMTASRGLGREPMPAELLPMMDAPQGKSRGLWAHWSLPTR